MPIRSLRHNRAHDYECLMRRWRAVAAVTDLRIKKYSEAGGCNLYCLASGRKDGAPSVYLFCSIHGDEAAATEGLIEWAQANTNILRNLNALVFPCLNPWGLVNNSRREGAISIAASIPPPSRRSPPRCSGLPGAPSISPQFA